MHQHSQNDRMWLKMYKCGQITWLKYRTVAKARCTSSVTMWSSEIWPEIVTHFSSQSSMNYTPYAEHNSIRHQEAEGNLVTHQKTGCLSVSSYSVATTAIQSEA